ncbi:MAG: hypothetical protein IT428_06150 [Planctomycetaceae bacterium]|nr:hypothetical protein [Planctomycetaceae bacterium]
MIDTLQRSNGNALAEMPDAMDLPQVQSRGSFIESQARGEVDVQIATAKRFPRSVKRFVAKATELATLDEETAQSCFYSLPRDGKNIEGPSARLAEIVAASWGNIRAQANIIDEDGGFITAQGICWDLENNVAVSTEVRRRITQKNGRRFSDDMIGVTANAACSIALRNAVFKVVPMALVRPVYRKAREVAIGNADTLNDRRQKMIAYFGKMGVRPEQICAKVDKAGIEDIGLEEIGVLIGISTAIKEGDTTIDEQFPAVAAKPAEKKSKGDELADSLTAAQPANGAKPGKVPEPTPEEMFDYLSKCIKHTASEAELSAAINDVSKAAARGELSPDQQESLAQAIDAQRASIHAEVEQQTRKKPGK